MTTLPDWARASGAPVCACRIRGEPADFRVTEVLHIEFSDDGEHDWLYIEKTGANTEWVARQLARHADVPARDVGYAGLKDRHAVTRQWFSVRRPSGEGTDWGVLDVEGVTLLEQHRHLRKLKRGAHRGNTFCIALRGDDVRTHRDELVERLQVLAGQGVPNYFGEQRFGRDGGNVALGEAVLAGRRVSRNQRSIGLSAVRSLQFNNALAARVVEGTWNRLLPGDVANLDGSGSVFDVDEVTPELEQRCADLDVHPCGALPALEAAGVKAASRPLRMRVTGLEWELAPDALWIEFRLGKGSFATSVLREVVGFTSLRPEK
ncbi:MAG: tRNA pseudouridine(13) synthase TruD [Woeseiaceae bacterium]|nr:tRNA pseudouridine(13) synthase TruD [Woeseiaceae bacterium]